MTVLLQRHFCFILRVSLQASTSENVFLSSASLGTFQIARTSYKYGPIGVGRPKRKTFSARDTICLIFFFSSRAVQCSKSGVSKCSWPLLREIFMSDALTEENRERGRSEKWIDKVGKEEVLWLKKWRLSAATRLEGTRKRFKVRQKIRNF